ncbi:M56 family metallopeptidase [Flavobacterium hiemivividum]|uniref:Peptidase M56 n=1 Tax=Flavobacterium hiemivividum TaxID=2541734 RepID=A0A4R5CTE6_9FLAO|nr:M56 family metallopeptidase [Flavobacterium hiemivividum]TDE02680.1 peptidase M56 [Flavobacterium hiemivividum]
METLSIYLIKSSGLLLLFFSAYHFMLRKETFFTSNRWFLLVGLVSSAFLPLLFFTKIIWVDPTPSTIDWSNIPITRATDKDYIKEYLYVALIAAYCIGILGLLAKFCFEFYSLSGVLKGKVVHKQSAFKFIDIKENLAPFSFFNTIVYNSSLYSPEELQSIIEHEKVHSEQHHTIDVLISRLFCILFWFNPIIWLYKKAILQNLEFIADSEASKKTSDKKAYQITLLKITTQENCVAITNHFYQSLIKKRIVMLNKNQSNKRNSWKYAAVIPGLIAFVLLFQIEVVAQEKMTEKIIKLSSNEPPSTNDVEQQENDRTNKIKTIIVNTDNNKGIDANTEIFIDGKKVSKEEMDRTNPATIATINVSKNGTKSTIQIITKDKETSSSSIFESNKPAEDLDLEKTDPTNLNGLKGNRGTYTVRTVYTTTEKNSAPQNPEYYVNGKKISPLEAESLSPNTISTVNVQKNGVGGKNSIHIVTKNYVDNRQTIPEPPIPPTPPTFNFKTPKVPNFPKAPKAPKGDPINGDKKAWADFNKKMEEFEKKMKAMEPEMTAFDKKMSEFDKKMEPFNAKMEAFEKEMKIYEKKMEDYQSKLNSN